MARSYLLLSTVFLLLALQLTAVLFLCKVKDLFCNFFMKNASKAIGQSKEKPRILVWNPLIATSATSNGITALAFSQSPSMNYAAWYLHEWSDQSDEDMVVSIEGQVERLFFECMRSTTMQGVIALDPYILFQKDIPLDKALQEMSVILRPECARMFFDWFKKTPIYTINPHQGIASADLRTGLDKWMEKHFGLTPPAELRELIEGAKSQDRRNAARNKNRTPDGQMIH